MSLHFPLNLDTTIELMNSWKFTNRFRGNESDNSKEKKKHK